jgi:hypothetical protein
MRPPRPSDASGSYLPTRKDNARPPVVRQAGIVNPMTIIFTKPRIFNEEPFFKKRPHPFRDTGWVTTDGYLYEADQLARCILLNRSYMLTGGRDYTSFMSLNLELELLPSEVSDLWVKITKKLRKNNFIGLWVREPSPITNHVNYHILSKSDDAEAVLRKSIPDDVPHHLRPDPFDKRLAWYGARYIVKAKTPKYFNGLLVSRDRWMAKRSFFIEKVGIAKYGTVGDFWEKGKTKVSLWGEIKATEKRISNGMTLPGADEQVDYLNELTQGHLGRARIRRAVGYHAADYHAEGTLFPPSGNLSSTGMVP